MKRKPLDMAKVAAVLAEHNVAEAMAVYEKNKSLDIELPFEERVIVDMVGKLAFYGSLSDKQFAFMARLLKAIPARVERDAARAVEAEAAAPIPADMVGKRLRVEGVVLAIKVSNGRFGPQTKMLVKHDAGFKLWGTVPAAAIGEVKKGDRIAVEAKVDASKDDAKFGFLSRPANLKVLVSAPVEMKAAA